ncbi:hypothetical protein PS710_02365 [Pseudomonas fluorescens]|uniref:Uncharacterized protein n=1 Tax=Pseudomonas fluorescens TaxID=294 RepID=A0A5E7CPJ4_PSEFL|nr:hypothetical protein PS710_02365 [Pseudomonas fluorescens]
MVCMYIIYFYTICNGLFFLSILLHLFRCEHPVTPMSGQKILLCKHIKLKHIFVVGRFKKGFF